MPTPHIPVKKAIFAVISNRAQYEKLIEEGIPLREIAVVCDNARTYDFLSQRGLNFTPVDEFLIRNEWNTLNAWGCTETSRWIKACRQQGLFDEVDLPSILYHNFSRMLVQILKNYRFVQKLMEGLNPACVIVFRDMLRRPYPEFSGNFILNYFLEQTAEKRGCQLYPISVAGRECADQRFQDYSAPSERFRRALRLGFKKFLHRAYPKLVKPIKGIDILVQGSLKHLDRPITALAKEGLQIALYDYEFHKDQYQFAISKAIRYLIPGCFPAAESDEKAERWAGEQKCKLISSLEDVPDGSLFCYEGISLAPFIQKNIVPAMDEYLKGLALRLAHDKILLEACRPSSVLLDEDYALHGGHLAALAKSRGIEVFCVSHANLAVDFSVRPEDRAFSQSWTFVNSAFEKAMYAARGWEESKILVTGTPRYDRLLKSSEKSAQISRGSRIKFLYCATGLWVHSPDQQGYLGTHFSCFRQTQLPAIRSIIHALEGTPSELVIKPHSDAAMPLWINFVRNEKPNVKITVVPFSYDIFQLYQICDAMILSFWSTAVIESAMLHLPTLLVDLTNAYGSALKEFSNAGLIDVIQSASELKHVISNFIARGYFAPIRETTGSQREYYLGPCDGKGTERVVDAIMNLSAPPKRYERGLKKQCPRPANLVASPSHE